MKQAVRIAVRILSSLKITVSVLALVIITSIPATAVVQRQPEYFYFERYSERIASLILKLDYDNYFSSAIFFFLVAVFFLNLFSCTLKRFIKQLRRETGRRFGPDILHLGLLVLLVGAVISLSTRERGLLFMQSGDSLLLPSGRYLNMEEFEFERYEDGRPKDWISVVNISGSPETAGERFEIQVNSPLRIDNLVIYQSGYRPSSTAAGYESGFLVTADKGKTVIILSFVIITAGLFITFYQKRTEL